MISRLNDFVNFMSLELNIQFKEDCKLDTLQDNSIVADNYKEQMNYNEEIPK